MQSTLLQIARITRAHAIIGLLLATPALGIIALISPDNVGYVLIATATTILYVSAQRINEYGENEPEIDDIPENVRDYIITSMLVATIVTVTSQLIATVIVSKIIVTFLDYTLIGVIAAVLYPIVDRLVGERYVYLSIGGVIYSAVMIAASYYIRKRVQPNTRVEQIVMKSDTNGRNLY